MTRSRFRIATLCVAVALLAFSQAAVGETESGDKATTKTKAAKAERTKDAPKAIVYYLHSNPRCTNCINFEKYTDELMKTTFADAVKSGQIEWRIVDTDKPENKHFLKDFKLFTKAIVVVDTKDGKPSTYRNLTGIWQTIGSKAKFQEYVGGEIKKSLGGD